MKRNKKQNAPRANRSAMQGTGQDKLTSTPEYIIPPSKKQDNTPKWILLMFECKHCAKLVAKEFKKRGYSSAEKVSGGVRVFGTDAKISAILDELEIEHE